MLDVFEIVNWLRVKNYDDLEQGKSHRKLTQLRTMKLLYYMQAASLVVRQKPLFSDPIKAWKYGPVVATVHGRYNGRREIVGTISQKDRKDFSKIQSMTSVVALLNKICVTYHNTNDSELVSQTHNEMPWQAADQSTEITKQNIRDAYLDKFNDKDWELIKMITNSDPDSLKYTIAKEKLEERGLLPSSIHDVKNETTFWDQFV